MGGRTRIIRGSLIYLAIKKSRSEKNVNSFRNVGRTSNKREEE